MTSADGGASTPNLPPPGQPVMVCKALFALRPTALLRFTVASNVGISLTATQAGMSQACAASIPAGANNAPATLACPSASLAANAPTTLSTSADLSKYLVTYKCKASSDPSAPQVVSKGTATVQSAGEVCDVAVTPLPPTLQMVLVNTAGARQSTQGRGCTVPAGAGVQVNPTYIDDLSPLCDDAWKALMARYYSVYQTGCTPDAVVAAAKLFAEDLAGAAGDPAAQARIVRAFAAQSCSGDYNPLFTGNGYTATAFGGLFAPTATEFVTSPISWARLPSAAKASVYLCINGKDGGQPVGGTCQA
jgi:hypothetical protein